MKKHLFIIAVSVLALSVTSCKKEEAAKTAPETEKEVINTPPEVLPEENPYKPEAVIEVTGDSLPEYDNSKPLIIDFNATWCGPCQQFKPIFHEVAAEYAGKATFMSVDVDQNNSLSDQYKVNAIPQITVVLPNGKVQSEVGFMDKPQFKSWLNAHLSR